jgi:ABC-type nitrate/sulfonate/bicarbonate transport system substrate-binding protein
MTVNVRTAAIALLAVLATGIGTSSAADRTVVQDATVAGFVAPWCLTSGFLYEPGFVPPTGAPNIDFQKTLLSPPQAVIAVENGELPMNDCVSLGTLAQAWAKGAHNAIIVAVNGVLPAYVLIGSKSTKNLADLKGKALASNGIATTGTQAVVAILQKGANLVPDRDYSFVSAATGGARLAALTAGKVDGISTYPPISYKLIDTGYPMLGTEKQYGSNYVQGTLVVNRQWAQANRPVLVAILKTMLQTGRWLRDPSKKNEVIAKLADVTMDNAKLGPDYARRIYADTISVDGGVNESIAADRALFQGTVSLMVDRGLLPKAEYPLDKMVDYSYLNEARRQLRMQPVKDL